MLKYYWQIDTKILKYCRNDTIILGWDFIKYYLLKSTVVAKDFSDLNYGILLLHDNGDKEYICNLSDSCDLITTFVDKLNKHHIERCHINSIIEDFKYTLSSNIHD